MATPLPEERKVLRQPPADLKIGEAERHHVYLHAPVGLCYFDSELRYVRINEWLARINGLSVEEHLGHRVQDVLPEVAAGVVPQLRQVIETGEPIMEGTAYVETPAHPGEEHLYEHSYYPRKSEDGTVIGVSCVIQDVTGYVAESELSAARFREIYDRTPVMMHSIDDQGRLISVNDYWLQMLGYQRDEVFGRPSTDFLTDESRRYAQEVTLPEFRRTGVAKDVEYQMVRKDGDVIEVLLSATANSDTEGHFCYSTAWMVDVTERKRLPEVRLSRERLRNLAMRLQAVREEEQTRIARELHDELGAGLTGLNMDLSWLAQKLPARETALRDKVDLMKSVVETNVETVRSIASRLRPPLLDDLGLKAAIEWYAKDFGERAGIKCNLEMNAEEISLDPGYATAVYRILQEALTNIARHADASRVEIAFRTSDADVVLEVRDDGKGISADALTGTGSVGLTSMRERAGALGGRVKIHRHAEGGTVVTATLPTKP